MNNNESESTDQWNARSIELRADIDRKRMEAHDNEYKRRHDDKARAELMRRLHEQSENVYGS